MITAALFLVTAAVGALVRTEFGYRLNRTGGFPYGTLATNVVASFGAGLLWTTTGPTLTVVAVGGLGTMSTISSFARDSVALAEPGELGDVVRAAGYVVVTLVGGVGAAATGIAIVS